MNTLLFLLALLIMTGVFWVYACAENTYRVRSAIREAIEHRHLEDRPNLRRDFSAVSAKAHFKREVVMLNPLTLYSPALQRAIAAELNLAYPR